MFEPSRAGAVITATQENDSVRVRHIKLLRHYEMGGREHAFRGRAAFLSEIAPSRRDLMCGTLLKNSNRVPAQIALHRKPGQVGRVAFSKGGCSADAAAGTPFYGDSASAVSEGESLAIW